VWELIVINFIKTHLNTYKYVRSQASAGIRRLGPLIATILRWNYLRMWMQSI